MLTRCFEDRVRMRCLVVIFTSFFGTQKKCERYWPVKEEKPLEFSNGIVVSLSSVAAFSDFTVRRIKVAKVS